MQESNDFRGQESEHYKDAGWEGCKGPSVHQQGVQGQTFTKGYRLVRPYQLGNRGGKRSSVDERRAWRMARPEAVRDSLREVGLYR